MTAARTSAARTAGTTAAETTADGTTAVGTTVRITSAAVVGGVAEEADVDVGATTAAREESATRSATPVARTEVAAGGGESSFAAPTS